MPMSEDLKITPLQRAVSRLEEALTAHLRSPADTLIRDGLVQRFEFTYEISQRLIRRYLADNIVPPEDIAEMTFADIIRLANQNQLLLGDWPRRKGWRDMRARTSHSYDEQVARDVVAAIPGFLDEARFLRDRLSERLNR
jgi:nucleotidyltransferase substrate binding protein (TIGR01987 family)